MKQYFIPAGILLAVGAGAALAQTAAQNPASIVPPLEPVWTKRPSTEQVWAAVPKAAEMAQPLPGSPIGAPMIWAQLDCAAAADGVLSDCRIAAESRPGLGVGAAAAGIVNLYAVAPPAKAGDRQTVAIRFQPEPPDTPASFPTRPSEEEIQAAWPAALKAADKGGVGRMSCLSGPDGTLRDCHQLYETPEGSGFSAALLTLAPKFKQTPGKRGGQPVTTVVSVGISFNKRPPQPPCPNPTVPDAPAPCYSNTQAVMAWAGSRQISQAPELRDSSLPGRGQGRWQIAQAGPEGLVMVWSGADWKTIDRAEIAIRREYWVTTPIQNRPALSAREDWLIDCKLATVKISNKVAFPERNRGGQGMNSTEAPDPGHEISPSEFPVARSVCGSRPGGDRQALTALGQRLSPEFTQVSGPIQVRPPQTQTPAQGPASQGPSLQGPAPAPKAPGFQLKAP